ncbi:hypothetical protein GC163_19495 [bacterium]|nr:hypothetical protein [bacterium]
MIAIRSPRLSSRHTTGFTLLEVVLSLAIFFTSMAVLSQINWNATRASVQAQLTTQALLRCEAKLQEIVAGAEPLSDQQNVPFDDNAEWTWSLQTAPTVMPELLVIRVTVSRVSDSSLGNASVSLERWMRDPEVLIEAAEEQAAIEADQANNAGVP